MGFMRKVLEYGDGDHKPKKGDKFTVEYTGNLYNKAVGEEIDRRGKQFESSASHGGDFKTAIGVGKVIQGWDEGIMGMSLGEKSILTISSDYAYGSR